MNKTSDITSRLSEEFRRLGYIQVDIAKKLDCNPVVVHAWVSGRNLPQAFYLAKLHQIGYDVIYILTGERTRNDQTGSENNC